MRVAAYDPAYILPFALHGLTEGCMDAEEFVRLGMLAVALASLSSPEESIRKLGYDILAKYLTTLEVCLYVPSACSRCCPLSLSFVCLITPLGFHSILSFFFLLVLLRNY